MPSLNETILPYPKVALEGCIMDCRKLNLNLVIGLEILTQAKQLQTSLPFPSLIKALCKRAGMPFISKTNVKITPLVMKTTSVSRKIFDGMRRLGPRRSQWILYLLLILRFIRLALLSQRSS